MILHWFCVAVGTLIGDFWFHFLGVRRHIVLQNLKIAFKNTFSLTELMDLAKKNFRHYGIVLCETMLLPIYPHRSFFKQMVISDKDWEPFGQCLREKRGAFLLTAHIGNWEMMCHYGAYRGMKMTVVTKKFKIQWIHDLWFLFRKNPHVKYADVQGTAMELLTRVRDGEFVAMMLDQHMQPPVGIDSRFFGEKVGSIRSLALLALRSQTPVIPVFVARENDGRYHIYSEGLIEPPKTPKKLDLEETLRSMTQEYSDRIEKWVRTYPEQWMWLHRRFKLSHHYKE